jgi:hypothetical protein
LGSATLLGSGLAFCLFDGLRGKPTTHIRGFDRPLQSYENGEQAPCARHPVIGRAIEATYFLNACLPARTRRSDESSIGRFEVHTQQAKGKA